jgi:hypothetical protein
MKRITAEEFHKLIDGNPSVFEYWNTPLEITEYVTCQNSPITHLSPHLIFSGIDRSGWAANFYLCKHLQIATGSFHGYVTFGKSAVQKIENLNIISTRQETNSATSFYHCENLQIATGTYPGHVDFSGSGIHFIQNLHIEKPNKVGFYSSFNLCHNLRTLQNWDITKQINIEPEKLAAEKERIALQNFHKKIQLEALPFL